MAHPKRRHSRARGRKRRTNWKIDVPTVVACKSCGQKKLQHFICPNCGFYREMEMIEVDD
ncbi:MAG: 50S ribosomal protein L32 [candidate division Zixibacteria bacterium]|nr:50S ribosomal protein L32 [candidate division Zixibacteria bacterium]